MFFRAIDKVNMATELCDNIHDYLIACGISRRKIRKCTDSTSMYHDLGLYGDIAESCMEVLINHYQVNLDGFNFYEFFPPEYEGKNWLSSLFFQCIPFASAIARSQRTYPPLRLGRINNAICNKYWE